MPHDSGTTVRSFTGANGATETFLCLQAAPVGGFHDQLRDLIARYAETQRAFGLDPSGAVFRRVFVSDALNQADTVAASALARDPAGAPDAVSPVAVSIVQQAPLSVPGTKLALLAYHVDGAAPEARRQLSPHHILIERNGLGHLWSTRLCAHADGGTVSAAAQTEQVFADLLNALEGQGGRLDQQCVRTWLYMKDVDVFYADMVKRRGEIFARHGLTADTHYIASTGIEGACAHRCDVVAMDAYSVLGLRSEQVRYLNDFDRLCATKDYQVTFERATRVGFADRAHMFISGTASIDRFGQVVHKGDVLRQLDRALENVGALLADGGGRLQDMMHLLVYLRDPADAAVVERRVAAALPGVPRLMVQGAVCRPDWLVEVEGIAAVGQHAPALPSF